MCFPQSQPVDNSAEIARQQEEKRQQRIASGQTSIDNAFMGFDPAYFDTYKQTYLNNYNPQVDEQFGTARKNLRYDYARKGTLNSTPAQAKFGDLLKSYGDARTSVASNADAAANDLRGRVDQTKGNLYQQNAVAADPSAAAVNAAGSAGSLMTPATYSPLADLFGGLINTGSSYVAGRNQALPAGYRDLFNPGSASGSSSRVVR